MTDQTSNAFSGRDRSCTFEYRVYFAIIFLFYLPMAFVTCVLGLCRPDDEDAAGKTFIARAWQKASVITPMIFSA